MREVHQSAGLGEVPGAFITNPDVIPAALPPEPKHPHPHEGLPGPVCCGIYAA